MADWQVGDLALCTKLGPWLYTDNGELFFKDAVRCGGVYTVSRVGEQDGATFLCFEGCGNVGDDCYLASRFRKVTPPKADEFDRETIALSNCAPTKAPAL